MGTKLSSLVPRVREKLLEPEEAFWADNEILDMLTAGVRDIWRRFNVKPDQDYFLTVDETNVTFVAGATTLTGVPTDVSIVRGVEAKLQTTYPHVTFEQKPYVSPEFQAARGASAVDPGSGGTFYFAVTGAGAPVGAPTIRVAPAITATIAIRLSYVPTLTVTRDSTNPIPGESDQALVYYAVAHLIGKDQEGQYHVDDGYLLKYENEVTQILVFAMPRATQDDVVAEALFEAYW